MLRVPVAVAGGALAALLALSPLPAVATGGTTATATFRAGSGSYLTTSGTDALRRVGGTVTFRQAVPSGPITATGTVSGLQPTTPYVTVPYKDGSCLPLPGLTAFPSSVFFTDAAGSARFSVTVNPGAILPVGVFDVVQTHSVSVRQVIVNPVVVPGQVRTFTVPNVVTPEACDRAPVVRQG